MAGYGFTYRGNSNSNAPQSNDWSRNSYSTDDHVCRPVIIDADGRKNPIVSYTFPQKTESYEVRRETIVQHVLAPAVSEYKNGQYLAPSPRADYGVAENKWHKSSGSGFDRPQQLVELVSQAQSEASRPRFGTLNWHRTTPTSTGLSGNIGGYGEQNDFSNKDWQKPIVKNNRSDYSDDYYRKTSSRMEPTMITDGGWTRPSREAWAAPPDTTLTKPTNEIGTAIGYLKKLAKPTSDFSTDRGYLKELAKPTNDISIDKGYLKEPAKPSLVHASQSRYAEPETWPVQLDTSLSKPSNEISTTRGYLKEPAKPTNDTIAATGYLKEAAKPSVLLSPKSKYGESETWDARYDTSLSKPANDISMATGYLKDAAKPSVLYAPQSRYAEPETWDARSNTSLTKPTNDISTARGNLQESAKPTYDNNTAMGYLKEAAKPSGLYTSPSRFAEPETWDSRSDTSSRPTNGISTAMGYSKGAAKPTNDVSSYTEFLKEAAKPSVFSAPQSRNAEPAYTQTIDSREAERRYGRFNFQSRPIQTDNNYATTIDSREAAKKYHGTVL